MTQHNRILCPLDLSDNSRAAIEVATIHAKAKNALISFLHVAPRWLPEEATYSGEEGLTNPNEEDRREFEQLVPDDPSVSFEHLFRNGNAGPEIVRESRGCDLIVMSTHGHGAMLRLLVGSVTQYVMRNAECPVIVVGAPKGSQSQVSDTHGGRQFVTKVMHQVEPIREYEPIEDVLQELEKARQTAAPVITGNGECIGILTKTDIAKYQSLRKRFESKDESVVDEMFEVDKYGQRRARNDDFHQVKRHMSAPVVTISNSQTTDDALKIFDSDPTIHHLVVIDETGKSLGILKPTDCRPVPRIDISIKPTAHATSNDPAKP